MHERIYRFIPHYMVSASDSIEDRFHAGEISEETFRTFRTLWFDVCASLDDCISTVELYEHHGWEVTLTPEAYLSIGRLAIFIAERKLSGEVL